MTDLFRTERTAVMATAMQQCPAWPVVFKAGSALTLAEAAYDAVAPERFAERQVELLDANNRYLNRARELGFASTVAIGKLEFDARHLVAEDDLADALHTLAVMRQSMRGIAKGLRQGRALADRHGPLTPLSQRPDLRRVLSAAIGHIEHMAAWIGRQNKGYSFESIGEDIGDIRAALEELGQP